MITTLYLVRHGETVDNARQIMQGQSQGELNENGIRQARQVSEEWKDRHLDAVIASDLKRSVDTARIIAEPHGLEVLMIFNGRHIAYPPFADSIKSDTSPQHD